MRRTIVTTLAIVVGAVLALLGVVLLYLNLADLGRHRSTVERLVTGALGRELRIAGDLNVDFGFDTVVEARGITLANPGWAEQPSMVEVDRLELEANLWSFVRGPIRIHRLAITGARVELEDRGDGRVNWAFDTGPPKPDGASAPISLSVGTIDIKDADLVYRGPALPESANLELGSLRVVGDATDMLDLHLAGRLNGTDLALAGRLGTLAGLLAADQLSADLEGHLGKVDLAVRGHVGKLATLTGADLEIRIDGPSMSEVTDLLQLPNLGEGPFRVSAHARPADDGSTVRVDGELGEVSIRASGVTDALLAPELLDLEFDAGGPNLSAVASLAGVRGAGTHPWSLTGRLRWQGFPITFDAVEFRSGGNLIALDGTLGAPPTLLDTDFRFEASGPDISAISVLGGLELPAEAFQLTGHLTRIEQGVGINDITGTVGAAAFRVNGTLGDPPNFSGTDLVFEASGPDLSAFTGFAGVELPPLPFDAGGELSPDGDAISLKNVSARLGENTATIEGTVKAVAGFVGTDLQVVVSGPGLGWLESVTGLDDLPSLPYRTSGSVQVAADSLRLNGIEARIGEVSARLEGRLGLPPTFSGTDLRLWTHGPDVSIPASLAGVSGLPAEPFTIEGGLRHSGDGFELDDLQAEIGTARIGVSGVVATHDGLLGTSLRFDANGPDISILGPLAGRAGLPSQPFSARGSLAVEPAAYRLDGVTATLGAARVDITGVVSASAGFTGTDADFSISGPTLAGVSEFLTAAGMGGLPELPDEPFSLTGGASIGELGVVLREVRFTLADAEASFQGALGHPPTFAGTDLTIVSDGPNASLFTALTGVTVPVAPFRVAGRLQRLEQGVRFHDLRVQLGQYQARADGRLGEPPALIGTDLEVDARGPSLQLVSQLARIDELPDAPFSLSGRFDGNPRRFKTDAFSATLGSSDVRGSFRVDLEGRPQLNADLESHRVDIQEFMVEKVEDPPDPPDDTPSGMVGDTMIPNEPFDLTVLNRFDGQLEWSVGELVMPTTTFHDLRVDANLEDGVLTVDPIAGVGAYGGTLNGSLTIRPADHGHSFGGRISLVEGRLDMSSVDDHPDQWPTIDVDMGLTGSGASAHEVAASANGRFALVIGEGVMDNSLAELVAADVLVKLLEALNPFRGEEKTSVFECAVVVVEVTDGVAVFDPVAIQTDKMTIVGDGKVNLSNEKINFDWVTKPRKGIGLSASMITNPYIKLGGTLAKPSVEMKPIEAAASTGLAVATGGLSLLGKGLLDRVTAEQKVCERAIKRAEKKLQQANRPSQ